MLKHRTKQVYTRNLPNQWDPNVGAQQYNPSASALEGQRELASKLNSYQTDGKVTVVPKYEPIPMGKPTSWPPIPPAYTPRPGTLVQIPYVENFAAPSTPAPQVQTNAPKIRRSGRVQRSWLSNNPDHISTWNLNQTTSSRHTTDVAHISPHPTGKVQRR